ncbi:hypothetical protein [Alteromonas mediterranea]|uniref:hypothetical protein n=1 Tax=Alteromonas mediterranea TaxID=314275 RepID=UPI002FE2FD52
MREINAKFHQFFNNFWVSISCAAFTTWFFSGDNAQHVSNLLKTDSARLLFLAASIFLFVYSTTLFVIAAKRRDASFLKTVIDFFFGKVVLLTTLKLIKSKRHYNHYL